MRIRITCVLAIAATFSLGASAAEQSWVTRSNQNAQLLLGIEAKYSPESASSLGLEGYDEAISLLFPELAEPLSTLFGTGRE